jgi:hypothetical protein
LIKLPKFKDIFICGIAANAEVIGVIEAAG